MAKRSIEERITKIREIEMARLLKAEAEADVRKRNKERLETHTDLLVKSLGPLNGLPLGGLYIQVLTHELTYDRKSVSVFGCKPSTILSGSGPQSEKVIDLHSPTNPPIISFVAYIDVKTSESWYQFGSQRVKPDEALDYALTEIERKLQ